MERYAGAKYLEEGVEQEFNYNKYNVFTIALLDIDGLTQINRNYGYYIGDKVIARTCRLLSKEIPQVFPVGRCGDDTFFVLFWGLSREKSMKSCDTLMRKLISCKWGKISRKLWVTFSIGFAVYNRSEPIRDTLIRGAQAMVLAKENGKNRVFEASEFLHRNESRRFSSWYS